ncbi:MAG: 2Fe-2S iron-sulfur cluster binding domain-containing protein [Gammaproteobacteria bacterium]|nr:2Fe-2S iron-sulfur cluster binding domain-containing protein [Gammaproteobacteria bacterium]
MAVGIPETLPVDVHQIAVIGSGQRIDCPGDETILRAMERLGLRGIPVGCRGGGCGVCRVRVHRGDYVLRRMSRAHVSLADEAAGIALACCLMPRSDLEIEVLGRKAPLIP